MLGIILQKLGKYKTLKIALFISCALLAIGLGAQLFINA